MGLLICLKLAQSFAKLDPMWVTIWEAFKLLQFTEVVLRNSVESKEPYSNIKGKQHVSEKKKNPCHNGYTVR